MFKMDYTFLRVKNFAVKIKISLQLFCTELQKKEKKENYLKKKLDCVVKLKEVERV